MIDHYHPMAPLVCSNMGLFLPHILQASTWGVVALHSLFLYSDMPPLRPSSLRLAQTILSQTFTCINTPTISSRLFFLLTPTVKMEQIECSETSAHKIQAPRNRPKERIQHSQHGESLKSRNVCSYWHCHWDPVALNDRRMLQGCW